MEFRGKKMDAPIIGHAGLAHHQFQFEHYATDILKQKVDTYANDCEVITWYYDEEHEETEFRVTFFGI